MDLSEAPKNGQVIHYSYLWRAEGRRGLEEGQKSRPCAVVLAKKDSGAGIIRVLVLPITHTPPSEQGIAIKITDSEKRMIGLDGGPQWIICNEVNQFKWPGFDVRPTTGGSHKLGMLPASLFAKSRALLLKLRAAGRAGAVNRDPCL